MLVLLSAHVQRLYATCESAIAPTPSLLPWSETLPLVTALLTPNPSSELLTEQSMKRCSPDYRSLYEAVIARSSRLLRLFPLWRGSNIVGFCPPK